MYKQLALSKVIIIKDIHFWLFFMFLIYSCNNVDNNQENSADMNPIEFEDTTLTNIFEEKNPNLTIREGNICHDRRSYRVMRNGKAIAIVRIGKPIMVVQALNEENWGWFQFPSICFDEHNEKSLLHGQCMKIIRQLMEKGLMVV